MTGYSIGRILGSFAAVWGAILVGSLLVWSASALLSPEPTRTFEFNFIKANVDFLAELALGGALVITVGSEAIERVKNR